MEALQVFLSSPQFAGLVITEFNANRDPDSALAGRFVEALASALDAGHRKWQEVGGSN
jgi:hypothetical protein